jgi:hypothetical protein
LQFEILAVQVQQIESIDRELAPLIVESSFEQSEKSSAPSGRAKHSSASTTAE